MADLMGDKLCSPPGKQCIEDVVGGMTAWRELRSLFEAAGRKMSMVCQAVPADYAVMRVLGG